MNKPTEIPYHGAYEVLAEILTRGDAKALVHALHVSPTLVSSWQDVPRCAGGEGALSPLDRVVAIVETLRRNLNPRADELLVWICARLGYLPPVRRVAATDFTMVAVGSFLQEAGEAIAAIGEGTADLSLDLVETRRIRRELRDVLAKALELDTALEAHERDLEADLRPLPKPGPFVAFVRSGGVQ